MMMMMTTTTMMMKMTMAANTNTWKKVRRYIAYIYIVYSSDTDGHPFVVLGHLAVADGISGFRGGRHPDLRSVGHHPHATDSGAVQSGLGGGGLLVFHGISHEN